MSNSVPVLKDCSIIRSNPESLESRLSKPSPGFLIDDCFCQERYPNSRYAGVPCQAEAEEAARRLRATFVYGPQNAGLQMYDEENEAAKSGPCFKASASEPSFDVQEQKIGRRQWESTPSQYCQTMTAGGDSAVAQCVELFQRNPDVQAAVMSLATDPAIWNAFVANEKVQELMKRTNTRGFQCGTPAAIAQDGDFDHTGPANPLRVAVAYLKNIVCDTFDSIVDIVHGVFGFIDKKIFGEGNADPLDQPLKACMVLTILILALIVFDRHPQTSKFSQDRESCKSIDT